MSNNRRQTFLRRIRATSRDQFILEEMQRLGFWPKDEGSPTLSEALIKKEVALGKEMRQLLKTAKAHEDPEAILAKIRKERMKASREQQAANKKKREQERVDKAKAWKEKQAQDIVYLGEGVSGGLNKHEENGERLQQHSLPSFPDVATLAKAMDISVGQLRFLAFQRKVSKTSHYKRYLIPKKRGGHRHISAPMPRLKSAQHWILEHILYLVPLHPAAHGFVPGRSILTNAQPHVNTEIVINVDLKDFFPSVSYPRVKGTFKALGYSDQIATILGLICTEATQEAVSLEGETYFIDQGERHLPQGAPTSPAITNILCRRLDKRLQGAADKRGFTYTRYADDMTFSTTSTDPKTLQQMVWQLRQVIADEGFTLHPDKFRIMRKGSRQEVTGIIVNEKMGIDRRKLKRFRALLFQIETQGPQGKHWEGNTNVLAAIRGFANYVAMVDPGKGKPLVEKAEELLERHGFRHEIRFPSQAQKARKAARATEKPKGEKPWWKFW